MGIRESFTDDEWHKVTGLADITAIMIIASGKTGPIQALKEVTAASKVLASGEQSSDELVKAVADSLSEGKPDMGNTKDAAQARTLVMDLAAQTMPIVRAKAPEHAEAYKAWLLHIAQATAEASKDSHGAKDVVSDEERQSLEELSAVLG